METVRLPSPVQKWFGHQLEIRGIDSVIYSRHIIHLLQQDDDEIQDYVDLFFDSKAEKKHQCKAARYDKKKVKNSEERKKSAAIECLQAVSDEVINNFYDLCFWLCTRLFRGTFILLAYYLVIYKYHVSVCVNFNSHIDLTLTININLGQFNLFCFQRTHAKLIKF